MTLPRFFEDRERCATALNHFARDYKFFDLLIGGQHVHHVEHQLFQDHAQAAGTHLAGKGLL